MCLCSRYAPAIGRCTEVGVATFGSGIEDKMSALAWNLTHVTQLRKHEALQVPEKSSEYCCVLRRYGIRPREGGKHEAAEASIALSVGPQGQKHIPPLGLTQPRNRGTPWAVSLRLKRSKREDEQSSFICC